MESASSIEAHRREIHRKANGRYREKHRDQIRDRRKKYAVSKEAAHRANKKYRENHKEEFKERNKKNSIKNPWYIYKGSAKKRGLAWELSNEDARVLIETACHYCGTLGPYYQEFGAHRGGIDRKDNAQGYVAGNVVPCCKRCNWAKGTSSYEEYKEWLNKVAEFVGKKNGV